MRVRNRLALLLLGVTAASACGDSVAPPAAEPLPEMPALMGSVISGPTADTDLHLVRHAPDAPSLETYEVSFWAVRGQVTDVVVNYGATASTKARRFLRFNIPQWSLQAGPDGVPLAAGDSLLITMSIDRQDFHVDFQPSGIVFSDASPAQLGLWYGWSDLAGNEAAMSYWGHHGEWGSRFQVASWLNDRQWIRTAIRHFSGYAVSW